MEFRGNVYWQIEDVATLRDFRRHAAAEKLDGHGALERATRLSPIGLATACASKPRGMAGNLP